MQLMWQLSEPESRIAAAFTEEESELSQHIRRHIRDGDGPVRVPIGTGVALLAAFEAAKVEDAVPKNTVVLGWMPQENRIAIATQARVALLAELAPQHR